ncbi:MAG: hypothetical protein LBB61_01240 [Treponema sp.]|nr:hypothetical protein [Treponema sp.]
MRKRRDRAIAPRVLLSLIGNIRESISETSGDMPDIPGVIGNIPEFIGDIPEFIGDIPEFIGNIPGVIGDIPEFIGDIPGVIGNIPGVIPASCRQKAVRPPFDTTPKVMEQPPAAVGKKSYAALTTPKVRNSLWLAVGKKPYAAITYNTEGREQPPAGKAVLPPLLTTPKLREQPPAAAVRPPFDTTPKLREQPPAGLLCLFVLYYTGR